MWDFEYGVVAVLERFDALEWRTALQSRVLRKQTTPIAASTPAAMSPGPLMPPQDPAARKQPECNLDPRAMRASGMRSHIIHCALSHRVRTPARHSGG